MPKLVTKSEMANEEPRQGFNEWPSAQRLVISSECQPELLDPARATVRDLGWWLRNGSVRVDSQNGATAIE